MPSLSAPKSRTASNTMPRRINSKLVLNTLRKHQPLSRVELARLSGLQPSTVSLIVEQLVSEDWLEEGDFVKGAMGRRPRLISLSSKRCVVGIDVHPKQTTLGIVDVSGSIVCQGCVPLPDDPAAAINRLIQAVHDLRAEHPDRTFAGIGMCLPGRTDPTATHLIFAPNLRWPIVDLKVKMESATGLPVHLENVANACALLEVWHSEKEHLHDLVAVEVSEGLGTGLFINGAIVRGTGGMAGEFGHIQMQRDGLPCSCGGRGCWETLASEPAALRLYSGRSQRDCTFAQLVAAANAGEHAAVDALCAVAEQLGRGMQMVVAALAPEEIVVVGDITGAWACIGPVVERELRTHPLTQTVLLRPGFDSATARLRSALPLVMAETLLQD